MNRFSFRPVEDSSSRRNRCHSTAHFFGACFAVCVVAACGQNEAAAPAIPVAKQLRIEPSSLALLQRDAAGVRAVAVDAQGQVIERAAFSYTSNDASIATVNLNGVVQSGTRAGSTTITVAAMGLSMDVPVVVHQRITKVSFPAAVLPVRQLDSAQIQVRALDVAGAIVADAQLTFISTVAAVASVASNGLVRSVGPPGDAEIYVRARTDFGEAQGSLHVHVAPTFASIDPPSLPLVVGRGSSLQLGLVARDIRGQPIAEVQFQYVALTPSLLNTTARGVIYSVGGDGQAVVRVRTDTLVQDLPVMIRDLPRHDWNVVSELSSDASAVAMGASGNYVAAGGVRGSWMALTVSDTMEFAPTGAGVALDPTERFAFFALWFPTIAAFDLRTGTEAWASETGLGEPRAITFWPGGGVVLVTTEPNVLAAIDTGTHQYAWTLATPSAGSHHIALHPTAPRAWVSGANGIVTEVDLLTKRMRSITNSTSTGGLAVSPNGQELYVVVQNGYLKVYDAQTLTFKRELLVGQECDSLLVSPDGVEIYLSCHNVPSVVIVDVVTNTVRKTLRIEGGAYRMTLAPDGSTLMLGKGRYGIAILR